MSRTPPPPAADPGSLSLSGEEAARATGGRWVGPIPDRLVAVLPLDMAGAEDLGVLFDRRYLTGIGDSRAGALLVSDRIAGELGETGWDRPALVVEEPHAALRRILLLLHPTPPPGETAIDPTARIAPSARIGEGSVIGAFAVIGEEVVIGAGCHLDAHVTVERGAMIGDRSRLGPQVTIHWGVEIGRDAVILSGARIGVDGFGYVFEDGEHRKVPQVGGCVLEDRVEVGANSCIDRGSIGTTLIGAGTKIDNLVHIAHNVRIGPLSILTAQVGIAGSTRIGAGAVFGGQAGVAGHLEIGAGARISAQAGVTGDVSPGAVITGFPARPHREFNRAMAELYALREKRRALEERISRLEELRPVDSGAGEGEESPGVGESEVRDH